MDQDGKVTEVREHEALVKSDGRAPNVGGWGRQHPKDFFRLFSSLKNPHFDLKLAELRNKFRYTLPRKYIVYSALTICFQVQFL